MRERKKTKKLTPKDAKVAAILTALEYKSLDDCEKILAFINSLPVNGGDRKNNGGIKE